MQQHLKSPSSSTPKPEMKVHILQAIYSAFSQLLVSLQRQSRSEGLGSQHRNMGLAVEELQAFHITSATLMN